MSYIFSIIFIVDILLCVYIGTRKDLWHAVASLVSSIVAAILAFGISKLLSLLFSNAAGSLLSFILSCVFSFLGDSEIIKTGALSDLINVTGTAIFSSVWFIILYIALYFILKIPVKAIYKKHCGTDESQEGSGKKNIPSHIAAAAVSGIIGFISFVLITSPVTVLFNALDSDGVRSDFYSDIEITETVNKFNKNPIAVVSRNAGGKLFFDLLTTRNTDYGKATPSEEITYILSFTFNTVDIAGSSEYSQDETNDAIIRIEDAVSHSAFLAPVISEIVPAAAEAWLNDDAFLDVRITIPEGRIGYLMRESLEIISQWDENNVRNDFSDFAELVSLIGEKDLTNSHDIDYLTEVISDEEYMEQFFIALYGNEDFMELMPAATYTGIAMVLDEVGIILPDEMDFSTNTQSITRKQAEKEAHLIAAIAVTASSIKNKNGSLSITSMSVAQVQDLCDAISGLNESYFLNELAPVILLQIVSGLDFNIDI